MTEPWLVSGQESTVSPEQLVGRLPEVTGEELAASWRPRARFSAASSEAPDSPPLPLHPRT